MNNRPKLDFPPVRLRARRSGDDIYVWDALRGKFLLLTPEEWVRRHVLAYLTEHCGFAPQSIVQEYPIALNGMAQRADIVVVGQDGKPLVLVECKAPHVAIDESTAAQAARYCSVAGARYIVLTNGLEHRIFEYDGTAYRSCDSFPKADNTVSGL